METTYDVIVVGAGTSGMMAAISAAEYGAKVLLIEKNKKAVKLQSEEKHFSHYSSFLFVFLYSSSSDFES